VGKGKGREGMRTEGMRTEGMRTEGRGPPSEFNTPRKKLFPVPEVPDATLKIHENLLTAFLGQCCMLMDTATNFSYGYRVFFVIITVC